MAREPLSPVSLPCSRQRPRAATAMQPTIRPLGPPAVSLGQTPASVVDQGSIGTASGPLRHPKPMTPSDLHSMLEKEQEAMVNRLSRELSVLRQQTTSVASTASSTSTTLNDPADALHSSPYLGNSTVSGRHRSSSSLSSSYIPAVQESRAGNVAGIAPSRDTGLPFSRPGRSRQQSINSVQQSGMTSPSLSSSLQHGDHFPHRSSLSQSQPGASPTAVMSRLEETAQYRGELESIKRENEGLRRRVRDLELVLKRSKGAESTTPHETPSALTNQLRNAALTDAE